MSAVPDAAVRSASRFLGKWVEVELTDGRFIYGQLACTDKDPNFILNRAEERWAREEPARHIGMAMLTRKHVKRILMCPQQDSQVL